MTDNLGMMQYSLYVVVGVCFTRCYLMIMTWRDRGGSLNFVFCDDGREREMGDEDGNDIEDMSGYEKSGVRLS
jgi:hypothetical protein